MTRMVEEERLDIGTMKALGYSRRVIMEHVTNALGLGPSSVAGFLIGYRLFPAVVIWNCYTTVCTPPAFRDPLIWPRVGTSGAAIAFILLATVSVCNSTLNESLPQSCRRRRRSRQARAAQRITPLWSRMKFTHKVTARNLLPLQSGSP